MYKYFFVIYKSAILPHKKLLCLCPQPDKAISLLKASIALKDCNISCIT
jgi:mannose/fructose/N-acetylgalactosamine-specific phosphotransferase system component IIB